MKTATEFIRSLDKVYCRLKPSAHGIGVFAIKQIPEGVNPFEGCFDGEMIAIPEVSINAMGEDSEVRKYIIDLAPLQDGYFYVPDCGLQRVDISFFLNHSKTPNMREEEEGMNFFTTRVIEVGEELTVDYTTYDDYSKTDKDLI